MNNREIEEKLEAYREMLISGQIDETTFNNMVRRNLGYNIDVNKAKRPRKSILPIIVVLLVCFIVLGLFRLFDRRSQEYKDKEYEYVENLNNLDPPIQNDFIGNRTIVVGTTSVKIDYVAYYEVSGRVVSLYFYGEERFGVQGQMAEKDITLVWGKLATDEYEKHFTWRSPGNRFVYWKAKDMDWYRAHTNDEEVTSMYANNHLIPDNSQVRNEIAGIRIGDYVRIRGYLANVYWTENGMSRTWFSSKVRTDDGDGACEVIYVTDVKWLKEA